MCKTTSLLLHTADTPCINSLWRKKIGVMHEFWNTSPFHTVAPPISPVIVHSKVKLYPGQDSLRVIPQE